MPTLLTIPTWVSAYGATLLIPAGFSDITEYVFAAPEAPTLHYLAFSEEPWDPAQAWQFMSVRHEKLASSLEGRGSITPLGTIPHGLGALCGFTVAYGNEPDSAALSAFALTRPRGTVLIRARTTLAQTAWLPGLFASIAPQLPGLIPPQGRHRVYDLSFVWPRLLQVPSTQRFESDDRSVELGVTWNAAPVTAVEPRWSVMFAYDDPKAQLVLLGRDIHPVQTGLVQPPFPVRHDKLILEQVRWFAHARGAHGDQPLAVYQAQHRSVGRSLNLTGKAAGEHWQTAELWSHFVASVNLEQ